MRNNQPVTQREYPFPSGQTLISTTDPDSRIGYVNSAFREASGFAEEELIGQYHNLIRHPDMPREAFRDMWDTLRVGLPWRGIVKNRRKDGDHYWVKANVTPLYRDDTVTGYLSVRSEPSRAEIDAAEALYRRMREEANGARIRTRLHRGEVVGSLRLARWRERWSDAGVPVCLVLPTFSIGLTLLLTSEPVRDVIGAVGVALALLTLLGLQALVLRGRTVRTSDSIKRLASRLAGGDLDAKLTEGDGGNDRMLFRMMEQLAMNLRGVVKDIRNVAEHVSDGASGITRSMNDISKRSLSQASSLQETSTAMSSMTGTIEANADSAQRVRSLAHEVQTVAESSDEAMRRVVDTMNEIHKASQHIEEILSVINTLSVQTNLLALNASVEAARAGEQGRGFAVVAAEVRNLAHQSAESADKIRDLVTASTQAVTGGLTDVEQAHGRMASLRTAIREVSEAIDQISTASDEQSAGVREINAAVSDIDAANQQTTERVDTSLDSTRRLEEQSRRLQRAVGLFTD